MKYLSKLLSSVGRQVYRKGVSLTRLLFLDFSSSFPAWYESDADHEKKMKISSWKLKSESDRK